MTDSEPILRSHDDYVNVNSGGLNGSPEVDLDDGHMDLDGDDDDDDDPPWGKKGVTAPNERAKRLTRDDLGMDDLKMPEGEGWTRL